MDKTIRILVLGTAGSGKSTLLRKISYPWSTTDASLSTSSSSVKSLSSSSSAGFSSSSSTSSSSLSSDILSNSALNHTIGSNVEIILHRYEKPSTPDNLLNTSFYPSLSSSSSSSSGPVVTIQLIEVSDDIEYQEAVKLYYDMIDGIILILDASLSADIKESEYLLDEFSNFLYRNEVQKNSYQYRSSANSKRSSSDSHGSNTAPHRITARRLQMIPFLIIANKVDKINRINTLVHNIVSGNYIPSLWTSLFSSSSSSSNHSPLSPLAIPRPAGTVTNTKIITRLDTSIAPSSSSSSSSSSILSSLTSSIFSFCSCRPSTRYFPITLTPTMIWTNLNNIHAPFPRDIIDHYFNEIIYMRYDYEHIHPDDGNRNGGIVDS